MTFVKKIENDRAMVAIQQLGAGVKDLEGKRTGLRIYINVFFPATFRGVLDFKYPDIVRVSGRVTSFEHIPDDKGKNTTIIRVSVHGYSITKALYNGRESIERELGAMR